MPGNKVYIIQYLESVVQKDISKLPTSIKAIIKNAIEKRIAIDPIGYGKPLRYTLKGYRRLRVGDYRIVYRIIPENNIVLITMIKHRKDVYE